MRTILYRSYGAPESVLEVAEVPEPDAPGPNEVAIRVMLRPIHPGDLLGVEGRFREPDDRGDVAASGARPGFEGMGVVEALGVDVRKSGRLAVGGRVAFFPTLGAWSEKVNVTADFVTAMPDDMSDDIASQVLINPLTAALLVRAARAAGAGQAGNGVVVLTAAGSAVAKLATALGQRAGLRIINLVRRSTSLAGLRELHPGIAAVASDQADWEQQLRAAAAGRPIRAILDPVGGDTATGMLRLLAPGGTLTAYGDLSGEPIQVPALWFSTRAIRIEGVSVGQWAALPDIERQADVQAALALAASRPELFPVAARYGMEEISAAVGHARQAAKNGTVLLTSS